MLIRLLVCAAVGGMRLVELAYSRRNLQRFSEADEGPLSRATYPVMVMLHTVTIGGTAIWGGSLRAGWFGLFLAAQPFRLWVLGTLRSRWTTRGSVPRNVQVATDGPYAYVRHPNYAVVFIELLSLPMAFGLKPLALVATAVNAVLLTLRIRDEERYLYELPGYREHFGDKPRFIPRLRFRAQTKSSEGRLV